jgi:hypothetical protein
VVDLLRGHRREGRRFIPTSFIEEGPRVLVEFAGPLYKVFTFREADGRAVLFEDCRDRHDALAKLAS